MADVQSYVCAGWEISTARGGLTLAQLRACFTEKLMKKDADYRGDADQTMAAFPLLVPFQEEVLRGQVDLDREFDSLLALAAVVHKLQTCKKAGETVDGLLQLQEMHVRAFQNAYGKTKTRPKQHYSLHLEEQARMWSGRILDTFTPERKHRVIPNMKWNSTMVDESDTEDAGSFGEFIVTCTHAERMDIIPLDKMFISHQYRLKHVKRNEHDWDIKMTLHRSNGKKLVYHFRKSPYDILASLFRNHGTMLNIYEMGDDVPCFLLMCAEEQSLITKNHYKDKFKLMHVVTTTEDDNLLSLFGRAKWKRCLRSSADCVFFAGPCTGGSPWNRLNKNINEVTAHNIHMKAVMYWELWEEFAKCLHRVIQMNAMALLELPRGCDYWTDDRMTAMINGTDSYIHEFDGCMYGLVSRYKDTGTPIKKPWRIVSWGVSLYHSKI
eukprot:s3816_g2.t1